MRFKSSLVLLYFSFVSCSTSFADVKQGESALSGIYGYITKYRSIHDGSYPSNSLDLIADMSKRPLLYMQDKDHIGEYLFSKDLASNPMYASKPDMYIPYRLTNVRVDGSPVNNPHLKGERDLIAYSDLYLHHVMLYHGGSKSASEWGNWITLWDNGTVEAPPFDTTYLIGNLENGFNIAFPSQASVGADCLTYEEFNNIFSSNFSPKLPPSGDSQVVADNYGPESLVQMSRRLMHPNIYGIEREALWKTFSTKQSQFTLVDLKEGAKSLGLNTKVERISLSDLQKSGSCALLYMKDGNRVVTLLAIGENRALIIDKGKTCNIERSVLENDYSGEALTPANVSQTSVIVDSPVRQVALQGLSEEVTQQFVFHNKGDKAITLQPEYPMPGVTELHLSKYIVEPNESVILDLKIKWRSVIKSPEQNVLVSIQTSDSIVPRLQLAVLLTTAVSLPK